MHLILLQSELQEKPRDLSGIDAIAKYNYLTVKLLQNFIAGDRSIR